jgi:hypothetical protein
MNSRYPADTLTEADVGVPNRHLILIISFKALRIFRVSVAPNILELSNNFIAFKNLRLMKDIKSVNNIWLQCVSVANPLKAVVINHHVALLPRKSLV